MTEESPNHAEVRIQDEMVVALYLHLKEQDNALPYELHALTDQLERVLYRHLSIEEMEQLDRLYAEGKPILGSQSAEAARDKRFGGRD